MLVEVIDLKHSHLLFDSLKLELKNSILHEQREEESITSPDY